MCVPAEELIELDFRDGLRRAGVIHYLGGKTEFMHRGYMDGVDLAFLFHTSTRTDCDFDCHYGQNGCIAKTVRYEGVAAHAGGSPEKGVNALYAASLGLQGINAIRETLRDDDHIRIHPIMTSGGAVRWLRVRWRSGRRSRSVTGPAMRRWSTARSLSRRWARPCGRCSAKTA